MDAVNRIVKVAESLDWKCRVYDKYDKEIELEKYSPAGEDFIMTISFDPKAPIESFYNNLYDYYNDFDAEEHAAMWINERGKSGVPDSIRVLLDDAESIEDMIRELCFAIAELKKYGRCMSISDAARDVISDGLCAYRIGFINADGNDDETELDVDSLSDLESVYSDFCNDCGIESDTVIYVDCCYKGEKYV